MSARRRGRDRAPLNGGKGVDYVVECSARRDAVNEAIHMVNRGGKVCLAAFPHEQVPVDVAHIVRNNIYLYGIRGEGKSATHRAEAFMSQKRFDATKIHTHTFPLDDLPTAIRYAKERIEDAIKVVVKAQGVWQAQQSRPPQAGDKRRATDAHLRRLPDAGFARRGFRRDGHHRGGHRLVAGATDTLPWAREGRAGDVEIPALIDVTRIPELRECRVDDRRVRLGAATPIQRFLDDPALVRALPCMPHCAVWFADDQIREQATIGGNIVNASPAADATPPLLAQNAQVELAARRDGRSCAER